MSTTPGVLRDWRAIHEAGAAEVGGKAWALARLARYGLPVPGGLVIPASAYREAPRDVPVAGLADALRAAGWTNTPLAVRSSAVGEDAAHASFAGIHHTALNVVGEAALREAVMAVWASLTAPPALAYRQRLGLPLAGLAMPVLVMPMIAARSAGIAFTVDPATGREDQVVVHANWGLGESLVNGQAEGDVFRLATEPHDERPRLVEQRLGRKAHTTRGNIRGGTDILPSSDAQRRSATLSAEQAQTLARLALITATALDPADPAFDIEWAHDGQRFWLLQARPITVRARHTYPALRTQPDYWSRANVKEVMPYPLVAAEWSGLRPLIDLLLTSGLRLGGHESLPGMRRGRLHRGHGYLNLSVMQWESWDAFDLAPADMNAMIGGEQPAITVAQASPRDRRRRWATMARYALRAGALRRRGRREVAEALAYATRTLSEDEGAPPRDDAAWADQLRAHFTHLCRQHGLHFLQGAGGASLTTLVKLLERYRPGQGHALASALMVGGPPSVTAQQNYDLVGLATLAKSDPIAWRWLDARSTLPSDRRDRWEDLPESSPFRRAFADFLARYGHRGVYESYLRNPRWREAPGYLLDQLRPMADTALDARRARHAAQRDRARSTIAQALPWWLRPVVADLVRRAQHESNDREAARSALMAHLAVTRRRLLQIGQRAVDAGWLAAVDDVFWLDHTETLAVLEGVLPAAGLRERVADRREQMHHWANAPVTEVLVVSPQSHPGPAIDLSAPPQASGERGPPAGLRGVPVGTGVAEGIARLVHSPAHSIHLHDGEILVAASTDPAWTPIFLRVGGLVVETGGALSHAAIVAREFGIPAVVNVPDVMTRIRDGERVRVDGTRGTVTRLAPADPTVSEPGPPAGTPAVPGGSSTVHGTGGSR